jgi:hypothetical protein
MATALVTTGGKPGSWYKYFGQAFKEPGQHGRSDAIANITGTAVYELATLVNLSAWGSDASSMLVSVGSITGPYYTMPRLAFSADGGITWAPMLVPLLHADSESWDRSTTSGELFAYLGLAPGPQGAGYFWFFYTYLEPGAGFGERYLSRRKVTMRMLQTEVAPRAMQARVALQQQYKQRREPLHPHANGEDHWATTAMVPPGWGAVAGPAAVLGTLMTSPPGASADASGSAGAKSVAPAARPLFDCYIEQWDDHMVAMDVQVCVCYVCYLCCVCCVRVWS